MTAEPVVVSDSITRVAVGDGAVIVTGSHGGRVSALYAARLSPRGVIFNDAGFGKESAGVAGLDLLDAIGVAASTVSVWSARIGDGTDTWSSGIISYANSVAREAGIVVGMSVPRATEILLTGKTVRDVKLEWKEPRPTYLETAGAPVVLMDSISQTEAGLCAAVIVSGSHGALVGGKAVKFQVGAVAINDAGFGKNDAGVSRLHALEAERTPGFAVDHASARIGDAWDTYLHGIVSVENEQARRHGIQRGMAAKDACELLCWYLAQRRQDKERRQS
jgi:hypothetical protein